MEKILIIDDEETICNSLKFAFEDVYEVYTATSIYELESQIEEIDFDVMLLDLKFGEINGIDLLRNIKKKQDQSIIIMMTAYGSIESSIKAMKAGAYDYLIKPLDMENIRFMLHKATEYKKLNEKVHFLESQVNRRYGINGIIGQSKKMKDVFHLIDKVKDIDINVLIQSESGTGKEMVAKAIHFQGKRKSGNFEVINCGAIPENLIESELFGNEKGAFTGADHRRKGRFELADGGTFFLDEIGEMNLNTQVKLLRVIEQKVVFPVGAEKGKEVDVRIIAATNKDLEKEVKKGNFREDLYFRLNVLTIRIPTLNERKEDISLLVEHFIREISLNTGKEIKGITREALIMLESHRYKGNVRELQNIIERAVVLTDHSYIQLEDLPADVIETYQDEHLGPSNRRIVPIKVGTSLREVEKAIIIETLRNMDNNKAKSAAVLGISERNLRYKIKEYEG